MTWKDCEGGFNVSIGRSTGHPQPGWSARDMDMAFLLQLGASCATSEMALCSRS